MRVRNVRWTVGDALAKADGKDSLIYQREALTVLAAEVRRLGEQLARIEALPAEWRHETAYNMTADEAAADLETALNPLLGKANKDENAP